MTNPLVLAQLPELTLDAGCTVTFEALSPTTGATVSGVVISSATLYGVNETGDQTPALPDPGPPGFTVEHLTGELTGA